MRLISVKIESNTRSHLLARAEPGQSHLPSHSPYSVRIILAVSLSLSENMNMMSSASTCSVLLSSSAAADFDQDLKSYDIEKTNRTPDTGWHSHYNYWITCRIDPQNGVNANSNT